MATVTPNFNWPVPTSTDLVKDGATAIEALGDSIDASLVDLKGGTTGQVLSKASNTDMDFTWVTDAAGDIQGVTVTSPLTGGGTSGTVTVGILSGTTSNLGAVQLSDSVSSTSTTLAATANAVKTTYDIAAAPAAGKNATINGGMDIWQRGTSISLAAGTSAANSFTTDRWFLPTGTNQASTVSRQSVNDSTNLPNIQYCARVQRNSGQTGTAAMALNYNFETANSIPFAGKTITVSFYARAGANYSPTSSILASQLYTGTGTDQNIQVGGFTGQTLAVNQNNTLTTTWQRFTYTYAVPSTVTQFAYIFLWTPTGTAGANDYFELTGVQMEAATAATAFSRNGSNIGAELEACQRYFETVQADTTTGVYYSTTAAYCFSKFNVEKRIFTYTVTYPTSLTNALYEIGTGFKTPTAFSSESTGFNQLSFTATGMSGGIVGKSVRGTFGVAIQVNAEL
jgi:hypothetical protein